MHLYSWIRGSYVIHFHCCYLPPPTQLDLKTARTPLEHFEQKKFAFEWGTNITRRKKKAGRLLFTPPILEWNLSLASLEHVQKAGMIENIFG